MRVTLIFSDDQEAMRFVDVVEKVGIYTSYDDRPLNESVESVDAEVVVRG